MSLVTYDVGIDVDVPTALPSNCHATEILIRAFDLGSQVDFVSVPFTHSAQDILECRALLQRCGV